MAGLERPGHGVSALLRRYAADEDSARAAGVGLWQTDFEPPWQYRAHRWEVAAQTAPEGCPIKGNISRDGERIYHTPGGSPWYARTKINLDQGERWFCSERQEPSSSRAAQAQRGQAATRPWQKGG